MDQALNSQKTPHTSPLRASYGMSFVSILMKNDRVIKGFYCIVIRSQWVKAKWHHTASVTLLIVGSSNGLLPVRCKTIIRTNADLLSFGPRLRAILIKIQQFSFKEKEIENAVRKMMAILSKPLCVNHCSGLVLRACSVEPYNTRYPGCQP